MRMCKDGVKSVKIRVSIVRPRYDIYMSIRIAFKCKNSSVRFAFACIEQDTIIGSLIYD